MTYKLKSPIKLQHDLMISCIFFKEMKQFHNFCMDLEMLNIVKIFTTHI